jgi:hypothetical protein
MRNAGLIDFNPTEIIVRSRRAMLDLIAPASNEDED